MPNFTVTILGSSSATPAFGRLPTSQIVNINQKYYLLDCGEGTQFQLRRYGISFNKIEAIFISHLHGDHYLGLIGLISSMQLMGRTSDISIICPEQLKQIIDIQLECSLTKLKFNINYTFTDNNSCLVYENSEIDIHNIPLSHRVPCNGFLIKEKQLPPKLDKNLLKELNIPFDKIIEIKNGADYILPDGSSVANSIFIMPSAKPRSYAFCTDTKKLSRIIPLIKDVDLLYHETTFLQDMLPRAKETFHSTTIQAAEIAKEANVKKLIIGHFSARYSNLNPFIEETSSIFPNVSLAIEGSSFSL